MYCKTARLQWDYLKRTRAAPHGRVVEFYQGICIFILSTSCNKVGKVKYHLSSLSVMRYFNVCCALFDINNDKHNQHRSPLSLHLVISMSNIKLLFIFLKKYTYSCSISKHFIRHWQRTIMRTHVWKVLLSCSVNNKQSCHGDSKYICWVCMRNAWSVLI